MLPQARIRPAVALLTAALALAGCVSGGEADFNQRRPWPAETAAPQREATSTREARRATGAELRSLHQGAQLHDALRELGEGVYRERVETLSAFPEVFTRPPPDDDEDSPEAEEGGD